MIKIDIQDGALLQRLKGMERQIPFAVSKATNDTAFMVRDSEGKAMRGVFDRPKPQTVNSVLVKKSVVRKGTMFAEVYIRDFQPKGLAPVKYLEAEIFGGQRSQKRAERALQARGLMPKGSIVVPGVAAPLDAYGNVPGSFYVKLLSRLGAFGEQGYQANETAASRKRRRRKPGGEYFALPVAKNGLKPGIYERFQFAAGSAVKPVLLYESSATYKPLLDYYGIARKVYDRRFQPNLEKAVQYAIATAR